MTLELRWETYSDLQGFYPDPDHPSQCGGFSTQNDERCNLAQVAPLKKFDNSQAEGTPGGRKWPAKHYTL